MNPASADQLQAGHFALQPRRVHTITDRFAMSNTYLISDERLIVVDPGSILNVRLLSNYLQKILGCAANAIDLIVLTSLQTDCRAGVEFLRRMCAAPIAASATIREVVQEEQGMLPKKPFLASHFLPGTRQPFAVSPARYTQSVKLVDLWLEDVAGLPFHPDWRVLASADYTPGSLCLYNPFTAELLSGDTIITIGGRTPLMRCGTNRAQIEERLRLLRSLRVHYLYPGRGRQILGEAPLMNVRVEREL